ncbi:hypothetical protein [Limosilactobacillus antri]|uniref:hypothetical protein n=1 Tax=Limosilactobacillus antri TaxID=227943 RepID=UPI001F5A9813|nr:hypothetical protein [Limosilactobacillus antri]
MNAFDFYFQCIDTLIDQYCEQNCSDVSVHELMGVTWQSMYPHLYYRAVQYCMTWNGKPNEYLPILLLENFKRQYGVSNYQYDHLFELRSSMRQSLILAYLHNKKDFAADQSIAKPSTTILPNHCCPYYTPSQKVGGNQ